MQAFCCEVVRARTKLGIAIAANRPMMATTIMISTSVKPAVRVLRVFICLLSLTAHGVNNSAGGLITIAFSVHLLPAATATPSPSSRDATPPDSMPTPATTKVGKQKRLGNFFPSLCEFIKPADQGGNLCVVGCFLQAG